MGSVVSIHRVTAKGGAPALLEEAVVIENFGLEGDSRSRKNRGRQITLIEEEGLAEVARILRMPAIPPGASRRQVLVRGINLNATVGKKLRVGPLLIQVEDLCDPCRKMETAIGLDARRAMESFGGICARVLSGGTLRPGDEVALAPDDAEAPNLFDLST